MNEDVSCEYLARDDTILSLALNNLFDGVYVVDRERKIIFWNRGAEHITGYGAAEVMGRRCSDDILNHVDGNGALLCEGLCPLSATLETGDTHMLKVFVLHKSGHRVPAMTRIFPIRDPLGEIIAAIEVFRNIAQQEQNRILQEKLKTMIEKYVPLASLDEVIGKAGAGGVFASLKPDLTVMFLDVEGFPAEAQRSAPDKAVATLNELFEVINQVVDECQGRIDKSVGAVVMAVFVDANDAVHCAQRILFHAMVKINAAREKTNQGPLSIRIGINSGMAIHGNVGATDRKDMTVIGDAVYAASRIVGIAEPDSILISEATFSRLHDPSKFEPVGEGKLKGRERPVKIYKYMANW